MEDRIILEKAQVFSGIATENTVDYCCGCHNFGRSEKMASSKRQSSVASKETNKSEKVVTENKERTSNEDVKRKNLVALIKELPKKVKVNHDPIVHNNTSETKSFIEQQNNSGTRVELRQGQDVIENGRVLWYEERAGQSILTVFLGDLGDDSDLNEIVGLIRDEEDAATRNERMCLIRRLSIFDVTETWTRPTEGSEISVARATGHRLFMNGQAQFNCNRSRVQVM